MSMPNKQKRSLNLERPISPPRLRRKLEHADALLSNTTIESPTAITANSAVPNPDHLRIFSWNVNGINPLLQPPISAYFGPASSNSCITRETPLRDFLRRHNYPQILCLQEVKIAPSDTATQRAVERATNPSSLHPADSNHTYTANFSLPRDPNNARTFGSKIYGVCTLIRNDFAVSQSASTRTVNWDLEGRVLLTELAAQNLLVVNGYWVNGTGAPYYEPGTGNGTGKPKRLVNGTRHDLKRRFHTFILDMCLDYERRGWKVLLIGDMNISRGLLDGLPGIRLGEEHVKNRIDFENKFLKGTEAGSFGGVDVWRHFKGEERKYTYFPRGVAWGSSCDRVDLCVVTRSLVVGEEREAGSKVEPTSGPVVVGMEILDSAKERGHSDHVPLFVTLDIPELAISAGADGDPNRSGKGSQGLIFRARYEN